MVENSKAPSDLRTSYDAESERVLAGLLHKRLYVAMIRPVRPLDAELGEQINALLPAHIRWVVEQERAGRLVAAGPFIGEDGSSYPGEGMFILQVPSLEDARRLVAADPICVAGLRTAEVRPWELNEGGFTLTVRFSDASFELA